MQGQLEGPAPDPIAIRPTIRHDAWPLARPRPGPTFSASATRVIGAPVEAVHGTLANYRAHRGNLLPKPHVIDMRLEQGGIGEGTIFHMTLRAFGRWREFRFEVTEPQPGRVLRERDLLGGPVVTFTLEPADRGTACRVHAEASWNGAPGARGRIEGIAAQRFARRLLAKELRLLDDHLHAEGLDGR